MTNENHEDYKEAQPCREPRKYKKELTIDFDLYEFEKQKSLKQGVQAGYTQSLNQVIRYLSENKRFNEVAKGDFHPLWQYVLKALGREDEWTEYEKSKLIDEVEG